MKKISIITLFPEFVQRYSEFGIIARAIQKRLVKFTAIDMRKFGLDKRKTVDDRPYGGGLGMVLRPDVVVKAIQKTSKVSSQASRRRDRGSSRII